MESVLADTHRVYIEELNEKYGEEYEYSDVDDWDWVDGDGREYEEFMSIVHSAWKYEWPDMPMCGSNEDIVEAIYELCCKCFIDVVTARVGVENEMKYWLEKRGVLPFVSELRSLEPGQTKANLKYDYYIDDNPNLAENIHYGQKLFLVDQPWNQEVEERWNVYRVNSVSDAVEGILDANDL